MMNIEDMLGYHDGDHPKPLHPGVWRTFNFKSVIEKLKTVEQIKDQLQ